MTLATVVIVNWNGAHLLPDCLDALAAQDLPRDRWQAWVVDNASSDSSLEVLANYPWARVLRSDRNRGFAGGNNCALREVDTPYAVLLNSDARPAHDWLRRLLAPLEDSAGSRLAAVTSKLVFLPRYVRLSLETPGFTPASTDSRHLGAAAGAVEVSTGDGRQPPVDVTDEVLWEFGAYPPEGSGADRFRWTRPAGELFVPVDPNSRDDRTAPAVNLRLALRSERPKPFRLRWAGGETSIAVSVDPAAYEVALPAGLPLVDVVNNAGGVVLRDGYGADRGFREVDRGQYDEPVEVLNFCGAAVALRMQALRQVGHFDEDFFLYYEDTDLSWRLQLAGWGVRYEPTALVRHIHSATSKEWSPLFVFHVDRNRLLMLTKDATPGLAARAVLRYPLTTASMARTAVLEAVAARRRPAVRPTLLRLRVLGSYLRLLPVMLGRRRVVGRNAVVSRSRVEQRLTRRSEVVP